MSDNENEKTSALWLLVLAVLAAIGFVYSGEGWLLLIMCLIGAIYYVAKIK